MGDGGHQRMLHRDAAGPKRWHLGGPNIGQADPIDGLSRVDTGRGEVAGMNRPAADIPAHWRAALPRSCQHGFGEE